MGMGMGMGMENGVVVFACGMGYGLDTAFVWFMVMSERKLELSSVCSIIMI